MKIHAWWFIVGGVWLIWTAGDAVAQSSSAEELMVRAHQARAQWNDFPGFEADVTLVVNNRRVRRHLRVTSQLELQWDQPVPPQFAAAVRRLESIVEHRQAGDEQQYDVEFVPEKGQHPLGRLIRFREDSMHSQYRIRGDVITQVSRQTERTRFTITVLAVKRNAEKKYLPSLYTVSFWSVPKGELLRSSVVQIQWERVGKWDLPRLVRSVNVGGKSQYGMEVIRLRNHRILEP